MEFSVMSVRSKVVDGMEERKADSGPLYCNVR